MKFKRKDKKAKGICALCLSKEGIAISHARFDDGVQLTHCGFFEGASIEEVTPAVNEFIEKHQLHGCDTSLVLRASEYRMFFLDAPKVPEAERSMAARFLIKDLINYPMEDAAIDVFEVPYREGAPSKVYVVAMPMARVQELNAMIESFGLTPLSISISELALNALTRASAEADAGIAFMYKDSESLHISLSKAGVLRMVRDIGPVSILENSEQHERLGLEIQRSLDFYQSQLAEMPPVKLYVTPRIASFESAMSVLQASLTIPVSAFYVEEVLPTFAHMGHDHSVRCLPVIGELQRLFQLQQEGGE